MAWVIRFFEPERRLPDDEAQVQAGATGPSPENLELARWRHAAHYLAALRVAEEGYKEGHAGVIASLADYDADSAHIAAGQAWAVAGEDEATARLAMDYPYVGAYVLSLRLDPRERVRTRRSVSARRSGDGGQSPW
ncbi:hypothetical protein [uncultured Thiodictyon sp.]|uniref:hypothetical protein n=1 Tax=uncultured Thiodictyon sp. TaxID=1846217 RepID=UPI0025D3975E|nr:hypothetical protein [uncultured Thiodictyon sp.]